MSVTLKELLHGHQLTDMPHTHEVNLETLLKRINIIREAWGQPMTVTSGYRSIQEHKDIYRTKGIKNDKIPMGSAHLTGSAVDIYDQHGELEHWLRNDAKGITCLEQSELWCEDDPTTPRVHFQIYPPKSGHRWFKP